MIADSRIIYFLSLSQIKKDYQELKNNPFKMRTFVKNLK
jgi:hypothetical protein